MQYGSVQLAFYILRANLEFQSIMQEELPFNIKLPGRGRQRQDRGYEAMIYKYCPKWEERHSCTANIGTRQTLITIAVFPSTKWKCGMVDISFSSIGFPYSKQNIFSLHGSTNSRWQILLTSWEFTILRFCSTQTWARRHSTRNYCRSTNNIL